MRELVDVVVCYERYGGLLAHASIVLLRTKETMGEDDGTPSRGILLGFLGRLVEVVG